jgi:hypothetical protein
MAQVLYAVNGFLSMVSDNVFVATIFIESVAAAYHEGYSDAANMTHAHFEDLAVAINMGTNLPSCATPNGQAAFLFILTSAVSQSYQAPHRLSSFTREYARMDRPDRAELRPPLTLFHATGGTDGGFELLPHGHDDTAIYDHADTSGLGGHLDDGLPRLSARARDWADDVWDGFLR